VTSQRKDEGLEGRKRGIRIALVVAALAVGLATLFIVGAVLVESGRGADPASALNRATELPDNIGDIVSWAADPQLVRGVEPQTRLVVEAAWVRAWHRVSVAQSSGDRAGIDTWFLASLAPRVASSTRSPELLGDPRDVDLSMGGVVQHGHEMHVSFYSLDGSIMTLDVVSDLERLLGSGESVRASETYEAVMLLSDGNWRVHSLTRTAVDTVDVVP